MTPLLSHIDTTVTLAWHDRRVIMRRPGARRRLRCMATEQRIRRGPLDLVTTEADATAMQAIMRHGDVAKTDADLMACLSPQDVISAMRMFSTTRLLSEDDLVAIQVDLADHLVSIDGLSVSDGLGHDLTSDDIDLLMPDPDVSLDLWMAWHNACSPTAGERKKNEPTDDGIDAQGGEH